MNGEGSPIHFQRKSEGVELIGKSPALSEHCHDIARSQRETSRTILDKYPRRTNKSAHGVCEELTAVAYQDLNDGIEQMQLEVLHDCEAGCNYCCHSAVVDVTPVEAIRIGDDLKSARSDEKLTKIKRSVEEIADRRRRMSTAERGQRPMQCGLLGDDGLCSVYEVRPLACRGCFSFSRERCGEAFYAGPNKHQPVPIDMAAKAQTVGVSGGLQHALVDRQLDGNLYELNSAVQRVLETPNAEQRWLAGEDIFKGCICTDRHSPPRKRIDQPSVPRPKMFVAALAKKKSGHGEKGDFTNTASPKSGTGETAR